MRGLVTCSGNEDWLSKKRQTVEARHATSPNTEPCRWCEGQEVSCWDPTFLSHFCSLFPVVVVKTVRAPLATAVPLLQVVVARVRVARWGPWTGWWWW